MFINIFLKSSTGSDSVHVEAFHKATPVIPKARRKNVLSIVDDGGCAEYRITE